MFCNALYIYIYIHTRLCIPQFQLTFYTKQFNNPLLNAAIQNALFNLKKSMRIMHALFKEFFCSIFEVYLKSHIKNLDRIKNYG